MLRYLAKEDQQAQYLFDNNFFENKPIPFPSFEKSYSYSNLFYWAHLTANETAEFPLHSHQGFEIMTFILNGSIEHFDTETQVWTSLKTGEFQVIQSGSGVMHAERIHKNTEVFQIWFDPDFSKALHLKPNYKNYTREDVHYKNLDGIKIFEYINESSKTQYRTNNINISRQFFPLGIYPYDCEQTSIYSIYVISGICQINQLKISKDDFFVFKEIYDLEIQVLEPLELFVVKTPKIIPYQSIKQLT